MTQEQWLLMGPSYKRIAASKSKEVIGLSEVGSVKYDDSYRSFRMLMFIVIGINPDCLNGLQMDALDDFLNSDCCMSDTVPQEFVPPSGTVIIVNDDEEPIVDDLLEPIFAES